MDKPIFQSKIETISTRDICVDPAYQRPLNGGRVRKIVREWNENLMNMPKVSFRDGKYWVFDGQHTVEAVKSRNRGKDTEITCRVFYGMTQRDEADLFIAQNGASASVARNDKLRALYNMGDANTVGMVRAAEKAGVKVDFKGGSKVNGTCKAVNALYKAYMDLGPEAFTDALEIIMEAWDGSVESLSRQIIAGMHRFYGDTYARMILRIYNRNTTTGRLPDKL